MFISSMNLIIVTPSRTPQQELAGALDDHRRWKGL